MFSCQFSEISHNIFFKERFERLLQHKHLLCLLAHLYSKTMSHIFWLNIFSVEFVGWGQEWAQYYKLLAKSLYSTQSNIRDWVFFLAKIVYSLKPLSIFAKKLHCDVLNAPL